MGRKTIIKKKGFLEHCNNSILVYPACKIKIPEIKVIFTNIARARVIFRH